MVEGRTTKICYVNIQGISLHQLLNMSDYRCEDSDCFRGLTSKDGSGMSDPAWLSKLLEGLKARSL